MKKFWGCFAADLSRACGSWLFLLAAVGSCAAAVLPLIKNFLFNIHFGGYLIWNQTQTYDSFYDFIFVVLACLPYGTAFCSDWNNRYIRSVCIRTGPGIYGVSKILSSALAGFAASFLGRMLTFLLAMISGGGRLESWDYGFSVITSDANLMGAFSSLLAQPHVSSILLYIFLVIFIQSIYAGCFAAMALMISAYLPNVFVALASPVIFLFTSESIMLFLDFPLYLYPEYIGSCRTGGYMIGDSMVLSFLYAVFYFLILTAIWGCMFSYKVARRLDRG